MTSTDLERFLLGRPARLVSIIGETLSGKTTLMCALYDRFLKGPFADFAFAGSRTIVGFERRSHYSRVESGYAIPETERTSIGEDLLHYHFALAPVQDLKKSTHLFLSDRAGETYFMARSNTEIIKSLPELQRSHFVVILLDGAKVADRIERAGAMQNVRQLIQAFLDNNDDLAEVLGVKTIIHGHHHQDYRATLGNGIKVVGLAKAGVLLTSFAELIED